MVKPNELRLGNLVYVNTSLPPFPEEFNALQVYQISAKHINQGSINIERIKPIPLTEEWLDNYSFKKDCLDHYCLPNSPDYFGALKKSKHGFIHIQSGNFDTLESREIRYVHELQNFYFQLTGEELE